MRITAKQHQLLTRSQILNAGLSDDAIAHRTGSGRRWQHVLPGVVATFTGALTEDQVCRAALLFAGTGSMLTGPTALRRYGLKYVPHDSRTHVLMRHTRRRQQTAFFVPHRSTELPRPRNLAGLPTAPPARALVDTCREMTCLRDVRALVLEAVQRRTVRLPQLEEELPAAAKAGTALVRRAVRDGQAGCRSAVEAELRDIVMRSKILPKILWNVPVFDRSGYPVGTPDGWIEEVDLVIQVDSREYHAEGLGGEDTQRRDNRYDRAGIPSVEFTPWRIRNEPAQVLREMEETYLEWRERRAAEQAARRASA